MTDMEAYNAMIDGFAVSHKEFAKDEFLYMDEDHIIRDENGNEYETTWDIKTGMDIFKTDWYFYKNRAEVVAAMSIHKKKRLNGGLDYIDNEEYKEAIYNETLTEKVIRASQHNPVFEIEDKSELPFRDTRGFTIESSIESNAGCNLINACTKFDRLGTKACKKCFNKIDNIIKNTLIILSIIEAIIMIFLVALVIINDFISPVNQTLTTTISIICAILLPIYIYTVVNLEILWRRI